MTTNQKLFEFTLFLADGTEIKAGIKDTSIAPAAEIAKDFTINGYSELEPSRAGRFIAAKSILAVGWEPAEEGK